MTNTNEPKVSEKEECYLVFGEDGCLTCLTLHKVGEDCILDEEETNEY